MGRQITKAEYFHEYAELLRAVAHRLKRDDHRTTLMNTASRFEGLAKVAENEPVASANEKCKLKKEALPRVRSRTRGT